MSNFKNYFNYFILLLAFKKLYFLNYLIIYLNKYLNIELDNCKLLYINFYNKYYFKYYKINDEIYLLKKSKYNTDFNINLYFKYFKIIFIIKINI